MSNTNYIITSKEFASVIKNLNLQNHSYKTIWYYKNNWFWFKIKKL